ncbi:MAG: 3-phosphoshikimate 1-carboxyvinyltransferase [Phycisphaerae bacterium]
MNAYHCKPAGGPLDATIRVPGSKSITNRALVLASLADGTSILSNVLLADDTRLMVDALRALGITITIDEETGTAEITGCGGQIPHSQAGLPCGNSGTTMRFLTALCALGHGRYELDGVERMRQRPIGQLAEVLAALGAGIDYPMNSGCPPITIHARGLSGGHVGFHDAPSSQMISALLMAAPYATGDVLIDVTGRVISRPYLTMTTAMMDAFGVGVLQQFGAPTAQSAKFIVAPQRYQAQNFAIEPDASNAAYFLAAAAIAGGTVTVTGLCPASIQGDAQFVDVLQQMGCRVDRAPHHLALTGPARSEGLQGIDVDLNDMPDMVQTLAVTALFAQSPTTIRNVASLRVKETDRLTALQNELTKLGATVTTTGDGLSLAPPQQIQPATIKTYNDHRMAMSFALAGLRGADVTIQNPDCCRKTFPQFFDHFESLGRSAV